MWIKYLALALLTLLLVARMRAKSATAGFGNLGLVGGLALGLSASPVLAATVTALFAFAAVLVPQFFSAPSNEAAGTGGATVWLRPLAWWLALGMILGIFLRVNDVLNFSQSLRIQYAARGFTDQQVEMIMAGHAVALARTQPAAATEPNKTSLQANERRAKLTKLLDVLINPTDSPVKNLERIKLGVSSDDLERIKILETHGMAPAQVIEVIKGWHAESGPVAETP